MRRTTSQTTVSHLRCRVPQVWTQKPLQPNVSHQAEQQKTHTATSDSQHRWRKDTTNLYVYALNKTKSKQDEEWRTTLIINNKSMLFKLDTGAECNVISKKVYDSVSKNPPRKTKTKLVAFEGHRLNPYGKANFRPIASKIWLGWQKIFVTLRDS